MLWICCTYEQNQSKLTHINLFYEYALFFVLKKSDLCCDKKIELGLEKKNKICFWELKKSGLLMNEKSNLFLRTKKNCFFDERKIRSIFEN